MLDDAKIILFTYNIYNQVIACKAFYEIQGIVRVLCLLSINRKVFICRGIVRTLFQLANTFFLLILNLDYGYMEIKETKNNHNNISLFSWSSWQMLRHCSTTTFASLSRPKGESCLQMHAFRTL